MEFRRMSWKGDGTTWNLHDPDVIAAASSSSLKSLKKRLSQLSLTNTNGTSSSRWRPSSQRPAKRCLPPYDPEQDLEKAKELENKQRSLPCIRIFRYSTCLDKILMLFGACTALFGGVIIPWIFYWIGKLFYEILLDVRCEHTSHVKLHPHFQSDISYNFLVNTGYAATALFLCNYLSWRCFAWAADRQVKRIASTYFEWILRKDMAWFDTYVDREFSQSMTEDITKIRAGIGEKLPALIQLISTEIFLTILAFAFKWELALIFFGLAPVCLILAIIGQYLDRRQTAEESKAYRKAGEMAEEILCNIKTVKIYQGEAKELSRFEAYLKSSSNVEFKWIVYSSICAASACCVLYCIVAAAIYIGTQSLDLGHNFCDGLTSEFQNSSRSSHIIYLNIEFPTGPHAFLIVLLSIGSISVNGLDIPYYIREFREAQRKAAQIFFLINWKPRIDNLSEEGRRPKGSAIGSIEIENVGLRYPRKPKLWAIQNATLSIYPGQIIGLVGRQSSGKSTLLKLLLRLYDPCEGKIMLDGHNLQSFNVRWLRSQITLLSQEPIIFPATIEENLRYMKPNATIDEIQDACKIAHIHARIMALPNGYQTEIAYHENENELTEREMRKLSVARTILCKPRIVLLDDPLLQNDDEFESVIISCIRLLHTQSTIIISASTANALMKLCDCIYYLQDGKILEEGTHLQLLRKEGAYYELIKETLVAVIQSKPRFVSQLMAYKFAKSLRKADERRKSWAAHSKSSKTKNSFTSEIPENVSKNQRNKRNQTRSYPIAFGVGGFQRYNFAKAATFNPEGVGNILRRMHEKRQGRDATRRSRIRISVNSNERPSQTCQASVSASVGHVAVDISGVVPTRSKSVGTPDKSNSKSKFQVEEPPMQTSDRNTTYNNYWNADNVSITSQDSQAFWDSYCDRLESLKRNAESGSWKNILSLGRLERGWIALGCFFSFILGLGVPCCALLMGIFFHNLLLGVDGTNEGFSKISVCLIILGAVLGAAAFFQEMFFSIAGKKMCIRLRVALFESMLKQDLEWFDSTANDISILCSRLSSDTDALQHVLLSTFGVVVKNFAIFIISVVLTFLEHPEPFLISIILVGAAVIMIIFTYCSRRMIYSQIAMMDSKLVENAELAYQVVSSIRSCIILGLERYFLVKYRKCLIRPFRHFYYASEIRCLSGAFSRSLPWLICALFIFFGFIYAKVTLESDSEHSEHHDDPDFRYLFTVSGFLIFGLMGIGESLALLTNPEIGKSAARRILNILEAQPRSAVGNALVRDYHKNLLPPKIQLFEVYFKYPDTGCEEVLRDINLEIEPNSYVAIVGPGKCGKTTLANIFLRLTEPTGGSVFFENENMDLINIGCIKRIMASLEQDSGLINDMTISENVRFGNSQAVFSEENVIEVTKATKIHYEILKLKNGYATRVSELESTINMYALKQRLALARALIRNPKILIIDDAASSVNCEHEEFMKDAIEYAREGRTLIILSEKIQPIRNADIIYVMNHGEIVEYGDDSHLLDLQGLYYNMFTAQKLVEASNQLQLNRASHELEESEMIDILRQKALSSKPSRKSTIAYTKFLSEHMESIQTHKRNQLQAMKEETTLAQKVETTHMKSNQSALNDISNDVPDYDNIKEEMMAAHEIKTKSVQLINPTILNPQPNPSTADVKPKASKKSTNKKALKAQFAPNSDQATPSPSKDQPDPKT